MIVCKFGGSSVSSLNKLNKIKEIVNDNSDRKIIVVSAIGKLNQNDQKMTDLLIELCENKNDSEKINSLLDNIQNKFLSIIRDINYKEQFKREFLFFKKNYLTYDNEYIISRGEYFTAKIIANFLGFMFCDSSEFIQFNEKDVNLYKSYLNFKRLNISYPVVIPGFYGKDKNGKIKLFSRGGGDESGSLISLLSNADIYENYTDVDGLLTINPTYSKEFNNISTSSYLQCYNASVSGAKVFSSNAIFYLIKRNIPLKIINLETGKYSLTSSFYNKNFYNLAVKNDLFLYEFKNVEKVLKSRFISMIINVFMLRKIKITAVFYRNKSLYIITEYYCKDFKLKCKMSKCFCITLYSNKSLKFIKNKGKNLYRLCKQKKQLKIYTERLCPNLINFLHKKLKAKK